MKKTKISVFVFSIFLILIDQITKYIVLIKLKPIETVDFIPGLIRFTYVENRGAAFGIFQNGTMVLGIVSTILLIGLLIYTFSKQVENKLLIWSLLTIFAGGAGNVIDRFSRTYVVDFLDLEIGFLKNFPVFNFADICVTLGAVLVVIYVLKFESTKDDKSEKTDN